MNESVTNLVSVSEQKVSVGVSVSYRDKLMYVDRNLVGDGGERGERVVVEEVVEGVAECDEDVAKRLGKGLSEDGHDLIRPAAERCHRRYDERELEHFREHRDGRARIVCLQPRPARQPIGRALVHHQRDEQQQRAVPHEPRRKRRGGRRGRRPRGGRGGGGAARVSGGDQQLLPCAQPRRPARFWRGKRHGGTHARRRRRDLLHRHWRGKRNGKRYDEQLGHGALHAARR